MSSTLFDPLTLWILLCVCSLSIIGSLSVIIHITFIRTETNNTNKQIAHEFIFWIIITDLIDAFAEMIGILYFIVNPNTANGTLCIVQAFGTQMGSIASILYTGAVAWIRYRDLTEKAVSRKEIKAIHFSIWIITLLCTILPVFTESYGPSWFHCWIDDSVYGRVFRISLFYAPLWIIISFISVIYCIIQCKLKNISQKEYHGLKLYPIVTIVLWLPATVKRLLEFVEINASVEVNVIVYILLLLVGCFDALIYSSKCCCNKRNTNEDTSTPYTAEGDCEAQQTFENEHNFSSQRHLFESIQKYYELYGKLATTDDEVYTDNVSKSNTEGGETTVMMSECDNMTMSNI